MTMTHDDYDNWAWLYDRTLGPDYSAAKISFFNSAALKDLPSGARVLDLCCGTGQMMAPLMARGLAVSGLDFSSDMLRFAKTNAPGAELIQADARRFTLAEPVQAVICASASLNHMETLGDLQAVFRSVYASLSDGGRFVFEMNHPAQMQKHWKGDAAAGELRADYAWRIIPRYDAATNTGAFTVEMHRRPDTGGRAAAHPLVLALLRRPFLKKHRLARIAALPWTHSEWNTKTGDFPVHGHAIADILALLESSGFDARAQTMSGSAEIDSDSAACFVATRKPETAMLRAAE